MTVRESLILYISPSLSFAYPHGSCPYMSISCHFTPCASLFELNFGNLSRLKYYDVFLLKKKTFLLIYVRLLTTVASFHSLAIFSHPLPTIPLTFIAVELLPLFSLLLAASINRLLLALMGVNPFCEHCA